jgi:hypothetical protein
MQHYAGAMLYQFPDNQIHAANDAVMRTKATLPHRSNTVNHYCNTWLPQ